MKIRITMKNGEVKEFKEIRGNYTNSLDYEQGFVVVTDVWGNKTSIPSTEITEIHQEGSRRW